MGLRNVLVLLIFVGYVASYSGQFVPKSYYIIDHDGHKSDVVYFRSKRDVELFPLLRMRRSGGGSSASSQSSSQASSSSHSNGGGNGGGGTPLYTGGAGYQPSFVDSGFGPDFDSDFFDFGGNGGGGGGNSNGFGRSFASSGSSSSSGLGQGYGGNGGGGGHQIPTLFSRSGEDTGTGVKVSGNAAGPRGAFSSSSSSIDSDGKITYSIKSGKY